jgi:hypothetical protein
MNDGFVTNRRQTSQLRICATVACHSEHREIAIENLRVATENLDQLSDHVKQNPWSLVRIRQPRDREVPKKTASGR